MTLLAADAHWTSSSGWGFTKKLKLPTQTKRVPGMYPPLQVPAWETSPQCSNTAQCQVLFDSPLDQAAEPRRVGAWCAHTLPEHHACASDVVSHTLLASGWLCEGHSHWLVRSSKTGTIFRPLCQPILAH